MVISKGWKWELLSKDDEYWNTPDFMIHYLSYRWKKAGFKTFLDLGCGLGRHSLFMAEQGFNVFAFDRSSYVVDVVKEKAFNEGLNVKVCVGNVNNIPYGNESIDCVLAMGVLSNSDKSGILEIIKEMYRVLKVNGEVYFNIISTVSDMDLDDELYNGNVFYNVIESDFEWLFEDFEVISIKHVSEVFPSGNNMPCYCVLLKKVDKRGSFSDDKLKDNLYLM